MKHYIISSTASSYLYILKHGIGPGTIPSDIEIIKTKDLPNGYTAVWLNRFLTNDEMKQYDIPYETDINYYLDRIGYCQKDGDVVPCDEVEACDNVMASTYSPEDDEDEIYWEDYGSEDSYGGFESPEVFESWYQGLGPQNNINASSEPEGDEIYWVQAYYSKPHKGLADDFSTNDWDAAVDKLIEFANDGYYVMFENLASGEGYEYDPDEVKEAIKFGDIYTLRRLNSLYEGY